MPGAAAKTNYEPELPRPDAGSAPAATGSRPVPARGGRPPADTSTVVTDLLHVQEFLQLLARAIRQFHTYPPTSPLCIDAIAAARNSLLSLQTRERVSFRVTPHELVVDEANVGAGTIIEHELVRRLHRSRVAQVQIDCDASARDLTRFCDDVSRSDDYTRRNLTLAEVLAEHGVDAIVVGMAHRPEVLDVGLPRDPVCDLVEAERRRFAAALPSDAPVSHLYPPDKGWVRLDPAARFDSVSLIDLTILVDDPSQVATMLLRLTDEEPVGDEARERALEQKFSDVSMLFSALDPRLARMMFAKLARAVLDLDVDRRNDLLKRTILPGLLDGRADGAVLQDFPDVDLAESLFLLLDLETAAPEVLTTALNRLDLPAERRNTVVPLLEQRLRTGESAARASEGGIDRYARKLVRIEASAGKNFADFAAFDLSMDEQAEAALETVRGAMARTDVTLAQLRCIWSLVRIEPNPTTVEALLARTGHHLVALERSGRWSELASELMGFRSVADALRESRPDVADAIDRALVGWCTLDRAACIADLYSRDADGKAVAHVLVAAVGGASGPALVGLVSPQGGGDARTRAVAALMCEHAPLFAPALTPHLSEFPPAVARVVLRMLGFAGAGYETAIAARLGRADEQTDREALRALARIGTPKAAEIVARELRDGNPVGRAAAEEALWHFPPAQLAAQLRDMFGNREFAIRSPQIALRVMERAGQLGIDGLAPALAALAPLRFRFWNRALVRMARKAQELAAR